jgi:CheY-like chemotaxis protein
MSHEIRTPINAILGMNEMIIRENKDGLINEYAQSVKSSGKMLLMLVNDVLDFSKIEAGKMEIAYSGFSMSLMLHDIMPMLKERADEKDLKLETRIVSDVPDGLISDEFRIRQILINIINNAIKYTDTGSVTLSVGGEYTGEDEFLLKFSIKDTGRGITEEDQKHLFEAFTRADVKKNRNIEGTGLGLAIVKSIVDSMGGEISVKSKYLEGSDFMIDIKTGIHDRTLLKDDFMENRRNDDPEIMECDYLAPDASILAVDDNGMNLKIVKYFLNLAGIEPDLCNSGTKAAELCRQKKYDLILLDHMMPDPDGIETLKIIRNDEDSLNRETGSIVLTANALTDSRKTYMEAGFEDYLTKPLDAMLLVQTVKKYLPADKIKPAE